MDERRFLVIAPTGRLRRIAEHMQAKLARTYRLYEHFPPPVHVTIEHMTLTDAQQSAKALRVIREVVRASRSFNLYVDGFSAFPGSVRAINLHVVETPPLRTLSERVHAALKRHGVRVRESLSDWRFHLTLASTTFAETPWSEAEFVQAFRRMRRRYVARASCRVDELQLWAPLFDPKPVVLATFPFRNRAGHTRYCGVQYESNPTYSTSPHGRS